MTERVTAPKGLPGWVWGGVFGCAVIMSWMGWNSRAAHQKLVETFGGESYLRCVKEARKVFATRLGPASDVETPQRLEDFVAIAEPIEVSPDVSKRFQELLTSSSSYRWDETVKCIPAYGYRLRFVGDEMPVEAWVCLKCGTVEFVVDRKSVGGGAFLPAQREFKELSTELFPGDGAIEEAAH